MQSRVPWTILDERNDHQGNRDLNLEQNMAYLVPICVRKTTSLSLILFIYEAISRSVVVIWLMKPTVRGIRSSINKTFVHLANSYPLIKPFVI